MSDPQSVSSYPVWDLPVRVSHWAIMLLFAWQFLSGHFDWLPRVHLWAGYLLLVVLAFRLVWGFVGSESARFGAMLKSMRSLVAGLADLGRPGPGYSAGHNPVGAISVLLMLSLLVVQSLTGLFVETWGELRGPLAERIGRDTALWLADVHSLIRWPLLLVIAIHVAAAFWHLGWKRENRIGAMLGNGRLRLPADPQLQAAKPGRALLTLLVCALAVGSIAVFGPID